ncbi:MAG: hypothetical protein Q8Q25_00740, partial [bacterium]|nr:hypothetical protein [bacterium]
MSSAKKRYGMCMVYTNRMMIVLCFCMGASLVATYVKIVNSQTIERMKMNDQKNMQKNAGQFIAYDKQGTPVIIEWQKTTLFAPAFATAMKAVWPLARKAYTPVEMQFLRAFPQVVGTEDYFKP